MIIYLIRHGITDACNNDQIIDKNVYLNELGISQIKFISDLIPKNHNYKIFCSDTKRTIQTANIINDCLFTNYEIKIDNRLLNKNCNDDLYYINIHCFLKEILELYENVILITHGKIIKMILSIIKFHKIDKSYTDSLDLGYGSIFILDEKLNIKLYNHHLIT